MEATSFLKRKITGIKKQDESYSCRFRKELQKMREEEAMIEIYLLEDRQPYCPQKIGVLYEGVKPVSVPILDPLVPQKQQNKPLMFPLLK